MDLLFIFALAAAVLVGVSVGALVHRRVTTKRIGDAAALFDIGLVDHIIIADGSSYSFRQYGLIK